MAVASKKVHSLPLQIGWLLDKTKKPNESTPVNLKDDGLKAHTLLIGQSGSGKSFTLGRLIEELVSKTKARLLILDPNSDFIRFSEIEPKVWTDPRTVTRFAPEDNFKAFENRWDNVKMVVLSNRDSKDLSFNPKRCKIEHIFLRWGELSLLEKAQSLGFSTRESPKEFYVLELARRIAEHNISGSEEEKKRYTLEFFSRANRRLWSKLTNATTKPNDMQIPRNFPIYGIDNDAVEKVDARCYELLNFKLWSEEKEKTTIDIYIKNLIKKDDGPKAVVVDLPSLDKMEAQSLVCSVILNTLRAVAKERWLEAIKKPKEDDTRFPIYIVVDEAHHLAPPESSSLYTRSVVEELEYIAKEGRKYGLFLLLATQRPSLIHPTILSQCDSLCLQKMNSYLDLDVIRRSFGYVEPDLLESTREFECGDALLAGDFIKTPTFTCVAPRRSVEGGRNLYDPYWLEDPF